MRIALVLSFIFVVFLYFRSPYNIGIDQAMYLQSAEMMLKGKKIYVDFIDINPPLIVYLNIPWAFIAALTGTSVILVFKTALLLFIASMTFCLNRILRANTMLHKWEAWWITWIFIMLSAIMVYVRAAGQREHLFILAFVPYFFLRFLNEKQKKENLMVWIWVVMWCALMSLLKPYFLFVVMCFELALAYIRRSWSGLREKEIFIFFAAGLLYGIHFLLWPTEIQRAFFQDLVPQVIKNYHSFAKPYGGLMLERPHYLVCGLVGALLLVLVRVDHRLREIKWVWGVTILACITIYLFQGKGWYYHFVPMMYFVILSVAIIVPQLFKPFSLTVRCWSLFFLSFTMYFSIGILLKTSRVLVNPIYLDNSPKYGEDEVEKIVLEHSSPQDFVVVLSPNPLHSYPAFLQQQRYPGTRYLFQFPMSFYNNPNAEDNVGLYRYKAQHEMSPPEAKYVEQIKSDIMQNKPSLIIFTNYQHEFNFLPKNFDCFQYFVSAGIWSAIGPDYELISKTPTTKSFVRHTIQNK